MSQLIQELKGHHAWVVQQLTDARKNPSAKTLLGVRKALVAHLKKEDEEVYPVLRAGDTNQMSNQIAARFSAEMSGIAQAGLAFLDKYTASGAQFGTEFIDELDGVMKVLGERISAEEMMLYPAYEKQLLETGKVPVAANAPTAQVGYESPVSMKLWFATASAIAAVVFGIIYLLG